MITDSDDDDGWRSTWVHGGWLSENPIGIPSEREVQTLGEGLPVVPSHAPSHRESLCKLIRCYNNFFSYTLLVDPLLAEVAARCLEARASIKREDGPRRARFARRAPGDCYSSRDAGCIRIAIRRYFGALERTYSPRELIEPDSGLCAQRSRAIDFANDSQPASSASSARCRAPPHAAALRAGVVFVLARPSLVPRNASFHGVAMVPNVRPRASTCRRFARKFHSETPCSREASSRSAFAICSRERLSMRMPSRVAMSCTRVLLNPAWAMTSQNTANHLTLLADYLIANGELKVQLHVLHPDEPVL